MLKVVLVSIAILTIFWSGIALAQDLSGVDEPVSTGPPGVMQTIQMSIYTVMKFWARKHDPNVEKSIKSGTFWMNVVSILCTTAVQILQSIPDGTGTATP